MWQIIASNRSFSAPDRGLSDGGPARHSGLAWLREMWAKGVWEVCLVLSCALVAAEQEEAAEGAMAVMNKYADMFAAPPERRQVEVTHNFQRA